MHKESFVMGVAGVLLGLLGGWIIGSQQGARQAVVQPSVQQASAPAGQQRLVATLDENRVAQLETQAEGDPRNPVPRVQLGNLYFDSERFDEAARWYEAALGIDPRDVDVNTDLGITYYFSNQPDRALAQFERSLAIDPTHSKTLLNVGVVRAWGKQDLEGAARAWERLVEVAPNSEEAARARQGLEGIRAAHPDTSGSAPAARPQGPSN